MMPSIHILISTAKFFLGELHYPCPFPTLQKKSKESTSSEKRKKAERYSQ